MRTLNTPAAESIGHPDLEMCRALVAGFCGNADLPTREQFTKAEVIELLRATGYAVDSETLQEFESKGYLTLPIRLWNAVDVIELVIALNNRRRWLPNVKNVECLKSPARIAVEQDEADFRRRNPLANRSAEDLLIMLTVCPEEHREGVYETLRLRLADQGVKL